jgi:1,2-diacylglycerol 3-beta-glucosyltransferase
MNELANLCLALLALPATFSCAYLALLTLLSWRIPSPGRSLRQLSFDVIVPAHNEETGIARTVSSLLAMDWPRDQFRVLVVADNCSDTTASVAREAGAHVLERQDETLRGKGYALSYAFARSIQDGFAEAVVVVDADAAVSANLLEAFAVRIERGARAVQALYGVLNPWSSWRTQLLAIAKGAFHVVRSRARERLGLSCGVRGNGWCVTHALLKEVPYRYYSLTEDVEYGIALGVAGCRVEYAGEAQANADMASSEKNARTQRQRWEQGRFRLVASATLPLLRPRVRSDRSSSLVPSAEYRAARLRGRSTEYLDSRSHALGVVGAWLRSHRVVARVTGLAVEQNWNAGVDGACTCTRVHSVADLAVARP